MASPLDLIAKQIGAGFKGKLLSGTISRSVPGTTLDEHGDPTGTTVQTFKTQGIVETFKATFRAIAGIPETDVSILLIAALTETVPTKEDKVTFRGTTYQVRKILEIDPANATYRLQGYKI